MTPPEPSEVEVRDAYWKCPKCGWLVSNIEYISITFDAPCMGCRTPYSHFHPHAIAPRQRRVVSRGMSKSVLGKVSPDMAGMMLQTGYNRFSSPVGIDGLAKVNGDRLDILAVHAATPGFGQFREFMKLCKKQFNTICIWEIWNPSLEAALLRYGFTPQTEITGWGETVHGLRWDKPLV